MSTSERRLQIAMSAGLLALLATDANAEVRAAPFALNGEYEYKADQNPACVERWVAKEDGTLVIQSGAERAVEKFRFELGRDDGIRWRWLVLERISTNGEPNCNGVRNGVKLHAERAFTTYQNSAGSLTLSWRTWPYQKGMPGTPAYGGTLSAVRSPEEK